MVTLLLAIFGGNSVVVSVWCCLVWCLLVSYVICFFTAFYCGVLFVLFC